MRSPARYAASWWLHWLEPAPSVAPRPISPGWSISHLHLPSPCPLSGLPRAPTVPSSAQSPARRRRNPARSRACAASNPALHTEFAPARQCRCRRLAREGAKRRRTEPALCLAALRRTATGRGPASGCRHPPRRPRRGTPRANRREVGVHHQQLPYCLTPLLSPLRAQRTCFIAVGWYHQTQKFAERPKRGRPRRAARGRATPQAQQKPPAARSSAPPGAWKRVSVG